MFSLIGRFFKWWTEQLAGCLPGWLRGAFRGGQSGLVVDFGDRDAFLQHDDGKALHPIGQFNFLDKEPDSQRKTVRKMLAAARVTPASAVVRLAASQVLRRKVELPSATAENLREVLSFEMDRHTPFKAKEVYFDYRIGGANPQTDRISIDLAVVPRATAERTMERVSAWGLNVGELGFSEGSAYGSPFFKLVAADRTRAGETMARSLTLVLALAACLLLAAVFYFPLEQKRDRLAALEARLAEVRAAAVESNDLKKRVDAMLAQSEFLVGLKSSTPSVTALLDEVTKRLPDNTWVIQFGRRGASLVVAGYSAKPSSLISLLEQSELFDEVRFSSPVTKDPRIGMDRFNISASISGQGDL